MKLFTVGYEGTSIDQFVDFLAKKDVEIIVDVRKNPVSRKKGFSKNRLAQNLSEKGIEYLHLPGLGVPIEWRHKAKAKLMSRDKMFQDYVKKILPKERKDINLIRQLLSEKNTCLLCFEADASDCHRHRVSDEVRRLDKKVKVVDLQVLPPNLRLWR